MWTNGTSSDLRGWRTHIERTGIAAMLYDEYYAGGYGTKDTYFQSGSANDGGRYLDDALVYWGDYLADTSSWASRWDICATCPNTDLIRADLLVALALAYDWGYPELTLQQRRDWRKKLFDEVESLLADPDFKRPDRDDTYDFDGNGTYEAAPNHTLRRLRTGHSPPNWGAIGIASNVLYREMQTTSLRRRPAR